MDFGLTAEIEENRPEIGKMARKPIWRQFFGHIFLFLGHFSPIFAVRPKSIYRRFFSYFGPEARTDFLPGGHVRKPTLHSRLAGA